MTIRDYLKRKVRWCYLAMLLVVPMFFLLTEPRRLEQSGPLLFLVLVAFFTIGVYMSFGIKCPKCGTRVGTLASRAFSPIAPFAWMKPTFDCCPGCGVSLESTLDGIP